MSIEERELTDVEPVVWEPRATLPGAAYHDLPTWETEKERVFYESWVVVARDEEIPEPRDYVVRQVGEESVIVARGEDGELRAFYNVCSHRGTRLCDATPEGAAHAKSGVFKCPYHAWTFTTEGQLVGTPNVHEEEGFDRSKHPLWGVRVGVWGGFVFVNLSRDGTEPLEDFLARNREGHPDRYPQWKLEDLRIGKRIVYEVAANWKIVIDNYNECLHCPSVHPELVQLVPVFRKGLTEGVGGAVMSDDAQTLSLDGKRSRPVLPGMDSEKERLYVGMHVYPNLLLNMSPDFVMFYRLEPIDPGHTRVVSEYLFDPAEIEKVDFDPSDVAGLWDLVSKQDWDVCEREQLGVRSRAYSNGGVYPSNDRWVHVFNERYRQDMGQPEVG